MTNIRVSSLLVVVLLVSQAQAQTAAPSSHNFTVSGSQTWTDTGVDVAAGDTLTFAATAKAGSGSTCNPMGGESGSSNEKRPLASAPAGALIAKISDSGTVSLVGAEGTLSAPGAGRLFLGLNQAAPSNCELDVKANVARGAGATAAPASTKEKLSSAAQVWLKGQFGVGESGQGSASNAVSGSGTAQTSTSAGLKLPTVILDSDLRHHLDSLPRRVDDHQGNLGDMVNFAVVGSQDQVQAALTAADWHLADVDNKEAGLKAIMTTVDKKDYLEMPMSHLYLFDRMQDFGYEQAQAFSVVASRHHFRIWKSPFMWNNEIVWVGAATHDIGFEKDIRTGKITHKIDPNVDDERENLAQSLQKSGKVKSMTYYLPPDPVQQAKNASGGSYHSDGRLLVVFVQ